MPHAVNAAQTIPKQLSCFLNFTRVSPAPCHCVRNEDVAVKPQLSINNRKGWFTACSSLIYIIAILLLVAAV